MADNLLKSTISDAIREGAEAAAKKGITQASQEIIEKNIQKSLRNSALDGFQKSVKEALEKNVDIDSKLTDASADLKKQINLDAPSKNQMRVDAFNKLSPELKKIAGKADSSTFTSAFDNAIQDADYKQAWRSYADKPKMGKVADNGDFKADATAIKKDSNKLQSDLDNDVEYKEKSISERQADFEKLKKGEADLGTGKLTDDAKVKDGVKRQGRGLFKSTAKAAGLAIAGVAFFAWANRRADNINTWNGNVTSITRTGDKFRFDCNPKFPEDFGCAGRKFFVEVNPANSTITLNSTQIPNCSSGTKTENINGITSQAIEFSKDNVPVCMQSIADGTYSVTTTNNNIKLRCETTTGIEAGCIIKEYGLEPLNDLFGGLGLGSIGKIIRTILIVIGVVILAVVIFKVIGYLKNRD